MVSAKFRNLRLSKIKVKGYSKIWKHQPNGIFCGILLFDQTTMQNCYKMKHTLPKQPHKNGSEEC
jgi:hypothetical protein